LSRWIAPVLSYTAEEIWENLPGDRAPSVFLSQWYELSVLNDSDEMEDDFWSTCLAVRQDVNKVMESERAAGHIRGSLDAM
jgi:isoleucyl-tRNA synthetase